MRTYCFGLSAGAVPHELPCTGGVAPGTVAFVPLPAFGAAGAGCVVAGASAPLRCSVAGASPPIERVSAPKVPGEPKPDMLPLVPVLPTTPPLTPPTWPNAVVVAQASAAAKRMALVMGLASFTKKPSYFAAMTIPTASGAVVRPDYAAVQRSTIAVTPIPPAAQIEISARPDPRAASCFAAVVTMRAPVAANGWPSATLDPLGLSLARSIEPSASLLPSRLRQ